MHIEFSWWAIYPRAESLSGKWDIYLQPYLATANEVKEKVASRYARWRHS